MNNALGTLNPALLICFVLAMVPMYGVLLLIRRYSYDFPFGDDWAILIRLYTKDQPLWEFWHFYNGHRVFIPQLMMVAIARLTDMDMRVYLYIDLAFASATIFLLYWIFRQTSQIRMPYLVLPAFTLLYMSLASYTGWITSTNLPNWTAIFYCVGGLWVASCWRPGWRALIAGAGFAYMGSLSHFYGNFIWLIVPLGWFLRGFRLRGWKHYVLWGIMAASVLLPYVWEYIVILRPSQEPNTVPLIDVIHFSLTLFGSAISGGENYAGLSNAGRTGIVGLIALGIMAVLVGSRRRDPVPIEALSLSLPPPSLEDTRPEPVRRERVVTLFGRTIRYSIVPRPVTQAQPKVSSSRLERSLPWLLLVLHVTLIALFAGYARASASIFVARAERYNAVSGLFWIAVVALLAIVLSDRRQWIIRLGTLALIFFIASGFLQRQFNVLLNIVNLNNNIAASHDCLIRYFEDLGNYEQCRVLYDGPGIDNIRNELITMSKMRIGWMVPRQFQVRKATLDPAPNISFETRAIDEVPVPSIFAHAPSRIDWAYSVPKGKQVTLKTGVLVEIPTEYAAAPSDGVLFEIFAVIGNETRSLYRAQVAPHVPGQGFMPVMVDLTPLAGQDIHLVLSTKPGESPDAGVSYDWALWLPLDVTVTN